MNRRQIDKKMNSANLVFQGESKLLSEYLTTALRPVKNNIVW